MKMEINPTSPSQSMRPRARNQDDAKPKTVIRILDLFWFEVLDRLNLWTLDRLAAHCRRETARKLREQLAKQKSHLN